MKEEPSVGNLFSPADISRVLPQQFHLSVSIARVPKGISHHLPWTCFRLYQFELNAWLCHCPKRCRLPVGLRVFLPHHRVELVVVLIAEDETHIVVVNLRVDKEGALEIDAAEPMKTNGQTGV